MAFIDNLVVFVLLIACANGLSVTAVASETTLGETGYIQCETRTETDDVPQSLTIIHNEIEYAVVLYPSLQILKWPNNTNPRYHFNVETSIMTILDVECGVTSDEAPARCIVVGYSNADGGVRDKISNDVAIRVKVRPKTPDDIVTNPANLTSGINDGSSLSATCRANVGRDGIGRLRWRIYRGNTPENVLPDDPRLQPITESDEGNCTKRYTSTLRLTNIGIQDQDLVLTCFVENDDFQPSIPSVCSGPQDFCRQTETIKVLYLVRDISVSVESETVVEGDEVTMTCSASGYPPPTYAWYKGVEGNATRVSSSNTYTIQQAQISIHNGSYFCVALNSIIGADRNISSSVDVFVEVRPTTLEPSSTPTMPDTTSTSNNTASRTVSSGGDDDTVIIVVVVVVVVLALIVAGIAFYCWRSRRTKEIIEEPPEKPYYNNRQNLAYQNSQPDLVTTDGKKPSAPSLNNSFDMNNEDGLRYADLTYDNRPRSRKPMAIGDTSSEYSDIQMPQV